MRQYLVLLLLATLPLQGLAAATLPFCPTDRADGHATVAVAAEAGALAGSGTPCQPDANPSPYNASCDNVTPCPSGAALLIPVDFAFTLVKSPSFYPAFALKPHLGFVPEQPQRPPLV